MLPTPGPHYDVFLSHDHDDADAVNDLGRVLTIKFGFSVWIDRWVCVPGESWQQAIAKGLNETTTCAVCVGERTARGWFRQEVERALDLQAADHRYRVIPVLLPAAAVGDPEELLPEFVGLRTWVDFRPGRLDPHALHLLRHGIQGTPPGPWPPLLAGSPARDTTLDEVERDLEALDRIRSLLHENVLIETQRRILSRRFTCSPHIFISYDHRDLRAAEKIATVLARVGLRPWLDQWEIAPGEHWETALARALESAIAVIALVGAETSRQVEIEARAVEARTPGHPALVPVLLPGAHRLPDVLADRTALDLRDTPVDSAAGAAAVLRAVLGALPGHRTGSAGSNRTSSAHQLREALERVRRILGDDHPDVVRAQTLLAASTPTYRSGEIADPPTTAELLHRGNAGDRAAWTEIISRYTGLVETVVRSFRLNEDDVADAIQRTWLRLVENSYRVRDPERLERWLATTAARECLAILRANRAYRATVDTRDATVDVEGQVVANEEAARLRAVVALLPARSRVLVQALFADKSASYVEVSRLTGLPVGSIGPTRARVLSQLRTGYERIDPASGRRTRGDSRINAATISAIVDDASDIV